MFEFEKRDDGFMAIRRSDNRPVCHLETTRIWINEELKVPKKMSELNSKDNWILHFTATKLTLPEHQELVSAIAAMS